MAGDESVMATVENEFNVITSRVTGSFGVVLCCCGQGIG